MNTIDQLEEAHQRLKVEYLDWAFDRYPKDHGIGSDHNSHTTIFLKNYSSSQQEVSHLCNEVMKGINQLSNPMEKYRAYREVYFIHPSFHERWFFDDHIRYLANNLYTGKHGFGLKSFLSGDKQKLIESRATFCIKRTILLENILSGYLDSTLSDYEPISDAKFPEYQKAIKQIIERNNGPEKIASLMPEVFQVIQTLLGKTSFRILESNKLLSFSGWGNYAQCAINEGPIFHKKSSESRVNIFRKIFTTSPDELQNELEKNFEIRIVRPFDMETAGSSQSQQHHNLTPLLKKKTIPSISKSADNPEKKRTSAIQETYRPEFDAVIATYKQMAGSNFRKGGTSSKENYIVKIKKTPSGVMYFFCHFPKDKKFSIELNVNKTRAPQFESTIMDLKQKPFERLPDSTFWEQKTKDGTWLRLQFFYPDNALPVTVVQGMFDLIDQSYPEILRIENQMQRKP